VTPHPSATTSVSAAGKVRGNRWLVSHRRPPGGGPGDRVQNRPGSSPSPNILSMARASSAWPVFCG